MVGCIFNNDKVSLILMRLCAEISSFLFLICMIIILADKCALFCFVSVDEVVSFLQSSFVNQDVKFNVNSFEFESVTYLICSVLNFCSV